MSIRNESPIANGYTFDTLLELKDAGLVAASDAAQVDGEDKIIDLGLGKIRGDIVIDATAVEVASGDEVYTIILELSNSATFASGIIAGSIMQLGDQAAILGAADADNGVGRYVLPFTNVIAGVHYQYARLNTIVAGTIATGVNYSAFIGKLDTNPA